MGFIEDIAKYVQKYAPLYDIKVCSPIIAQAILESASGTSNKVVCNGEYRHNYFGLKWRDGRCAVSNDYFEEWTAEQRADGSYRNIVSKFCKFKSMEDCVIGYFQWTNISNYSNLKGVTDPQTYLENIKADGYATSLNYVKNLMNVISKYDLTKYDGEVKIMTKIAIDAGHGSNTAGKRTVDGYKEHYINVKSASYCEAYLKNYGIECIRVGWNDTNATDDPDIALATRQKTIKAAKCDYSISFHANAHGDGKNWTSASGVETLYSNNILFRKDSKKFAECIQAQLIKGTAQKNRGAKAQSLAMCNCVAMGTKASALVEIGFMTNSEEAELMKQDWFCKEQGEDVARGILNYLGVAFSTETKPSNTELATYSLVFDYRYYATRYPDLKAVFGFDEAKLFNHFKTYGMKEGRQAIASFNPIAYKERYSDLQKAFGNEMPKYYTHYIYCGYREKRIAV